MGNRIEKDTLLSRGWDIITWAYLERCNLWRVKTRVIARGTIFKVEANYDGNDVKIKTSHSYYGSGEDIIKNACAFSADRLLNKMSDLASSKAYLLVNQVYENKLRDTDKLYEQQAKCC